MKARELSVQIAKCVKMVQHRMDCKGKSPFARKYEGGFKVGSTKKGCLVSSNVSTRDPCCSDGTDRLSPAGFKSNS